MSVIIKRLHYRDTVPVDPNPDTGGIADRFLKSFDIVNWSLSGVDYKITIPFAEHMIAFNPTVTVYLDNAVTFEEVIVPVFINSAGDVTITVSSSPNNRFKGKLTVL